MHSSLANRQIVKLSSGRLGVGSGGLAVVIAGPHGKNSDAAPDIAVTDARLLSKLHHAAVGSAAEKASSLLLPLLPLSPERCLACFEGVKNRFHLRECRGRPEARAN